MAAAAPDSHVEDANNKQRNENLFIQQENHKFDDASVSILFSVNDHDDVD